EIHDYLRQLDGNPQHYDDSSIYLAYKAKSLGDDFMENEYKQCFAKSINDTTYEEFYRWIVNKSIQLNTEGSLLCGLLYEKKKRNFDLHSDISDFFLDCRSTFEYSFNDLLKRNDLNEVFNEKESNALKNIYETYFCDQIDCIRRLEQQRSSKRV
ncbi:unnamed protein product, partial [Didymodactylos carnosus]